MENNRVLVMVKFADKIRRNNNLYTVVSTASQEIEINRRFLMNLETVVTDFKELGTVTIWSGQKLLGTLEKTAYTIGDDKVEFERFGGKIAKAFFTEIDRQLD